MSKPILEKEEVQALLSALGPEEKTSALLASLPMMPQPETVDDFEYGENQAAGPDQYPMFSHLHNRFAEMMIDSWGNVYHSEISAFFKETTAKSYLDILDNYDPRIYFTMESPDLGSMLVVADMPLVVSYIDAVLGGNGDVTKEEDTVLTPLELKLAERVAQSISATLAELWKPLKEMEFELKRTNLDPMSLALTAEDVTCFSITNVIVVTDDIRGDITIHYPLSFLEPMLMAMRAQIRDQSSGIDEEWDRELQGAILHTRIPLRLELSRCQISVSDFLQIKPGDFLPIVHPEDEAAILWIDQYPSFTAKPGQQQGMLAAEIIEQIPVGGTP